jgi:CSLREA domain-containing protein
MASAIMGLCLYSTAEAAITVDTTIDADNGADGLCSLREAITAVNNGASYNECTFTAAPETIDLSGVAGSITLLSALPALVNSVTITGPVAASLAVSGNNLFRVFDIAAGTVTISNLTIRNGSNVAGAGLRFAFGSIGSITDSTISNNTGDGILSNGTLSLGRSTVSQNAAGSSGIHALGIATQIVNSTISSNLGTGILVGAAAGLTMFSSTVTGNGGAGLSNDGMATVNSTIFSANTGGNCTGTQVVTSTGYNLEDKDVCGFMIMGDLVDTNPRLEPLQNNGGPTFTHALTAGIGSSLAIDAGDPNGCGMPPLDVDQRGVARPNSGGACDIGAYEWHAGGGGGGGGGRCSLAGENAAFDPTLWLLALVSVIYLGQRRYRLPR